MRAERTLLLARQTGFGNATAWAQWALGILGLELGEPVTADDALGPMARFVERDGLAEPVRGMFVADEIEALVALEQLDRAERLIDILEESGARHTRAWAIVGARRGRALLFAARGDLNAASKSAASALEWCGDLELELEVARTMLVAGQIERRRKRRRAARELLEDALHRFESAGAVLWAKRARLELERVRARREPDALTTTEQLVADLSASGLTNREVAGRLHISPKTVESNLARVYLKLGIRSRAELGTRLGRERRN
jgi:DNA-binding CsgD family transcriptional regulator